MESENEQKESTRKVKKLEVAYFVDVVTNPERLKIRYFDPYERSAADQQDMDELLREWNGKGRPSDWKQRMLKRDI